MCASKLFSKDFLEELEARCKDNKDILDFLIEVEELSFHDAVVRLAHWKGLMPRYLD